MEKKFSPQKNHRELMREIGVKPRPPNISAESEMRNSGFSPSVYNSLKTGTERRETDAVTDTPAK